MVRCSERERTDFTAHCVHTSISAAPELDSNGTGPVPLKSGFSDLRPNRRLKPCVCLMYRACRAMYCENREGSLHTETVLLLHRPGPLTRHQYNRVIKNSSGLAVVMHKMYRKIKRPKELEAISSCF